MWTLDPIDGTKGFLRGGQYAVCLALVVDAQVELGVIGCPNLPSDVSNPDGPRGSIFVAVKGQGVEEVRLRFPTSRLIQFFCPTHPFSNKRLCKHRNL
jgi:3'(2'), 5'-bisphosphate nucleotidase